MAGGLCGVKTLYIEPGAPWENAYSETFISRMRDELLEREMFVNLKEAQVLLEDYHDHYNHMRPHGALGYLTPAEFAATEALRGQSSVPSEPLKSVFKGSHCNWHREWDPVTRTTDRPIQRWHRR